jgi:hypothetical protein
MWKKQLSIFLFKWMNKIRESNFPIGILSPNDLSRPDPTQPTPTDGVVPLSEMGKVSFFINVLYVFCLIVKQLGNLDLIAQ